MNTIGLPPVKTSFMEAAGFPYAWIAWLTELAQLFNTQQKTGTTAQRPTVAPYVGFMFYDTTIGKPVFARAQSPATWFDSNGNPA